MSVETNAYNESLKLYQAAGGSSGQVSILIAGMIVTALTTIVTAVLNYLSNKQTKATSEKAALNSELSVAASSKAIEHSERAVVHSEKASSEMEGIHKAVNGERMVMIEKMDKLEKVIIRLTSEKAVMAEQQQSMAEAVPVKLKILILDDDRGFLEILQGFLDREGEGDFQVDVMSDPVLARPKFMERKHDVYIVDYRLSETLSGLDFIRDLRGAAHMGPFIVLSAFVDKEIEKRALNEGVQMVRTKESVIRGGLGRDVRYAVQAFRTAQRAKGMTVA